MVDNVKESFVIPGRLPGYNDMKDGHWAKKRRIKAEAMEIVCLHAKIAKLKSVRGKAKVTIACFEPNGRRDDDNVMSGASKIILDALQRCEVLKGDGRKYVQCIQMPVEIDKQNPRIEVTIMEADQNGTD